MGHPLKWRGGRRPVWRTCGVLAASWAACLALLLVPSVAGARAFLSVAGPRTANATESRSTSAAAPLMTAGSLSASPTPAISGEYLAFTGRVPPRVARQVALQQYRSGSWATIAWGRTSSTGSFRLRSTATATCTYRVRAPKTTVRGRNLSAVVTPTRQVPIVVQTAALDAPLSVSVGETITVTVTAAPVRAGRAVVVQEQDAEGNWVDVASDAEDATGTASITLTRKVGGQWQLRAVVAAANGAPECATVVATWPPAGAVMQLGTVGWTRTSSVPIGWNWAKPDLLDYYTDDAGSLAIVTHDPAAGALAIEHLRPIDAAAHRRREVQSRWPAGQTGAGSTRARTVASTCSSGARIPTRTTPSTSSRSDATTATGTSSGPPYVQGGAPMGIFSPFAEPMAASAPHMVLVGERLVVHMARLDLCPRGRASPGQSHLRGRRRHHDGDHLRPFRRLALQQPLNAAARCHERQQPRHDRPRRRLSPGDPDGGDRRLPLPAPGVHVRPLRVQRGDR